MVSAVSVTSPVLAADCASIMNNKNLIWTILDDKGTKIATGRIIVSKVTKDGYFETRHSGGNNPAMVFYGGFDGANMMYLNPDYQELWVGQCAVNKITGTVKNNKFEITPQS
jgi:hypothetical protein